MEHRRGGVEQGRLDRPIGEDHPQRGAIGGHLAQMGGGNVRQRSPARCGPVLKSATRMRSSRDEQPVDRPGDDRAARDHRRDRRLGERVGAEQIGEARDRR